MRRRARLGVFLIVSLVVFVLVVLIPVAESFLITNNRFSFPEGSGALSWKKPMWNAPSGPLPEVPILFIAGGEDIRMPLDRAERLYRASASPESAIQVVEGASHGRAFATDPGRYLDTTFSFLEKVLTKSPEVY